jgi:lipopolysaccharide/colanic/teichoic acid biosynthesis glycosyltransferase
MQETIGRNGDAPLQVPCRIVPYAAAKRLFDLTFAISLLVLTAPVMLLAALGIKVTSRGPILFKQVRVGAGGRHFWCYKLRSMCVDAEAQKPALMHLNEASGPVFKIQRDPRITPVGGILRKLSIDELPQLWNVIRGDMSVVGPRPPLPAEVAQYGPHELGRLAVQPGLTCLWQINGRSNISFDHWVELDLIYIDTMSLMNDIKIVCRTIPTVLFGVGAR